MVCTHGSTFGGNPLAAVVAKESLKVLINEDLPRNADIMGNLFRQNILKKDFIKDIRGKGLMNAIEFESKEITDKVCDNLLKNGLLTKSTHDTILRMSPPLVINEQQMYVACDMINDVLKKI